MRTQLLMNKGIGGLSRHPRSCLTKIRDNKPRLGTKSKAGKPHIDWRMENEIKEESISISIMKSKSGLTKG